LFFTWEYYCTESFYKSCTIITRDFLWPIAVSAASYLNASPYKMFATNITGISWTIYNCFFAEHDHGE